MLWTPSSGRSAERSLRGPRRACRCDVCHQQPPEKAESEDSCGETRAKAGRLQVDLLRRSCIYTGCAFRFRLRFASCRRVWSSSANQRAFLLCAPSFSLALSSNRICTLLDFFRVHSRYTASSSCVRGGLTCLCRATRVGRSVVGPTYKESSLHRRMQTHVIRRRCHVI
jgi:hypothetical protein